MQITIRKVVCGVFCAALALATHTATAQMPGPPPAAMSQVPVAPVPPKRDVDTELLRMIKRYDLTDSQAAQARSVLNNESKKTEAMLLNDSIPPMGRLTKLSFLREEEIARISPILNADQREQYIKDLQPIPPAQFQKPANFPPPPPGL